MTIFSRCLAAFAAILLGASSTTSHAQQDVPLSAYGALPDVEEAVISPDAGNIAVLMTQNGVRQIVLVREGMQVFGQLPVGDLKIRYLDWVGDEMLLIVSSQTEDLPGYFTTDKAEFSIAQLYDTRTGEATIVFSKNAEVMNSVMGNYGSREIDGERFIHFGGWEMYREKTGTRLGRYTFRGGRMYLYAVDTDKHRAKKIAVPTEYGEATDFLLDKNGKVAARIEVNDTDGDWALFGEGGKKIASGSARNGAAGLLGLGYDGTTVLFSERGDDSITRWYEMPLTGGEKKPYLKDIDVERLYFHDETGNLLGYLDEDRGPKFLDERLQSSAVGIRQAFAGLEVRMADWTPDFKKVLVRTSGNGDSGSWFVVDLVNGKADPFAYERMAIGPKEVGPISTVAYKAADGLEMDGILTLPPGREAKDLPVVMLPHGGPHAHDREQFDGWAQAFASRGYAVFQPKFRGSTNRSQQFKLAGYGQWGRKMQTDISDGLAMLAEKGIVDPDRACIVGASYGGYAALAGVTIQQDLYKCAVAVAPVSDLQSMYNEDYRASGRQRTTKGQLLDQLGPRDSWDAVSPRRLADRADAPVMLIHGVDDTVVPYSHSKEMAEKLEKAGKPFELVTLEGEDHFLSFSATRLQMLEAAVGFVEKHNPAD